jgi:hypothetical protein
MQSKTTPPATMPADLVGLESLTERLDVAVELRFVEDLIQSCVERVHGGARQILEGCKHQQTPLWRRRPVVVNDVQRRTDV